MGKLRRMRARRATRLRVRPRPRCGLRSGSPSNVSAVGASLRAEIAHQARKAVPEGAAFLLLESAWGRAALRCDCRRFRISGIRLSLQCAASFLRPIIEKVSDDELAYVSITRYE